MTGRTNAAGGAPLNFKVVGGTSAPASPKENTIWVNTDAQITSWVFRAAEPDSPAEGMVWFTTASSGPAEFNALKKNNITVCPVSAKQYAGGAWADKTAETYLGGNWVGWALLLAPNMGIQWQTSGVTVEPHAQDTTFSCTLSLSATDYADTAVDLTGCTQLQLAGTAAVSSGGGGTIYFQVGIFTEDGTFVTGWSGSKTVGTSENVDNSYDISALTGAYRFRVSMRTGSNSSTEYSSSFTARRIELK